jgi:photosystem II stability/assembly factor-like uncharacterized protein
MKAFGLICALVFAAVSAAAEPLTPQTFDALEFRYLAPPGNKTITVSGVPGNPNVVYAGTPGGGVFKSVDGGFHWKAIFDNSGGAASIGALSVSPSSPDVVWVGTGDSEPRENFSIGNGMYRSTDGGLTWSHIGLDASGHIARIAVDPANADVAFVAVEGQGYAPQKERGLFETRDAGKTWKRVLFVDESTGAADVIIDPTNPRNIFAAMWQFSAGPGGLEVGGPGSGIYRSRDGGATWQRLSNGLPSGPLGRIGLALSAKNPQRIYAVIATAERDKGSVWMSNDGGDSWVVRNRDNAINVRYDYYGRVAAFPDDPDEVYFLSQATFVSHDGGATVKTDGRLFPDNHDIWIDPKDPSRVIVANDRYLNFSTNRGVSWRTVDLPNAQFYRAEPDRQTPYNVYGNRHDGPGWKGPSNNRVRPELGDGPSELTGNAKVENGPVTNPITTADWSVLYTAEVGVSIPDPFNDNYVWLLSPFDLALLDQRTGYRRDVAPWPLPSPENHGPSRYRISGFALLPSVHRAGEIFVGTQYLHVSYDMGATWQTISPDLTANALQRPPAPWADGVVHSALQTIAESPMTAGVLWVGSNDGLVHVTRDTGQTWTDVTRNLPGLGPMGVVTSIEASHTIPGKAYVTVDRHKMDDGTPYVFRTTDYGASWKLITAGIPKSVVSYARVVKEDPRRPGLLYLGTEGGLYVSVDDGDTWFAIHSGLPRVPVSWVTVQGDYNDLLVSTFGRGIWVMDDIAPIQEFTAEVARSSAHLFKVRPTYLLDTVAHGPSLLGLEAPVTSPSNTGTNPPLGAPITYYLRTPQSTPVSIQILDPKGSVVRSLNGDGEVGIHRIWWRLDRDGEEGKSFDRRALLLPGLYTVRLTVGTLVQETPVTVMEDPRGPQHLSPLDPATTTSSDD